MIGRYRAVLSNRNFALLLTGQLISWLGSSLYLIALLWLVQDLTGSRAMMGLVAACRSLPSLLGFAAGAVVDRWDRRRIMITSELVRCAIVALVPVLDWMNVLQAWHLPVIAALLGLATIFFVPARQSLMPSIVAGDELIQANGLMALGNQFISAAGFAMGGVLIGILGIMPLFVANAVSFIASAASIFLMDQRPRPSGRAAIGDEAADRASPPTPADRGQLLRDIREGFAFIAATPLLTWTMPFVLAMNLVIVPLFVLLPAWARDILGGTATTYGLLQTSHMVGLMIGSLLVGVLQQVTRRSTLIFSALSAQGVALFALVVGRSTAAAGISLAVFGILDSLITVTWLSYAQRMIPRHMLGRVFGAIETVSQMLVPAGQALGGVAGQVFALPAVYLAVAASRTIGSAFPWVVRRFRSLLDLEPPAPSHQQQPAIS